MLFRPLLISSSIFPENNKAETVCMSILDALKEKASLLDQWIMVHESMYGPNHDIPSAESIHLSKMHDGIVTTDTCNSARALSELISFEIKEAIRQKLWILEEILIMKKSMCTDKIATIICTMFGLSM